MKKIILSLIMGLSLVATAHDDPKISMAKIAELSAHRADRLVSLGKIDASFVTKLAQIEVTKVSGPATAAYKSLLSQTLPQTGLPMQVEMLFDHDGKPLSFKLITGGASGPDEQWTPKSAGELIENGMHYVLDNEADSKIAPYYKDFAKLVLIKGQLNGKTVGLVQVTSSAQAQKLNVYVNLDGTFNSAEVVP